MNDRVAARSTASLSRDVPAPRALRLGMFVAASVLVHGLLLAWFPDFLHRVVPASLKALDVSFRAEERLPAAEPVARADRRPAPELPSRTRPAEPVVAPGVVSTAKTPVPSVAAAPASATVDELPERTAAVPEVRRAAPTPREPAPVTPASYSAAYLQNPSPRYPAAARRSGEQGTVTLKVLVTREGMAANVAVDRSSGSPLLDSAALEAVKSWRFVPARQGAQTVEAWVLVPIVFRLEGPG